MAKNLRFYLYCIIILPLARKTNNQTKKKKKEKSHYTIGFYKVKHPLSRQWFTGYGIETGALAGACKSCSRGWCLMKHSCGHPPPVTPLKTACKKKCTGGIWYRHVQTISRLRGFPPWFLSLPSLRTPLRCCVEFCYAPLSPSPSSGVKLPYSRRCPCHLRA